MSAIQRLSPYICDEGIVRHDPTLTVETPKKIGTHLPEVMSYDDVERLLDQPNESTPWDYEIKRCSKPCMRQE